MCYTYSIAMQMFNETIRTQYQLDFEGSLPLLSNADLFYTSHGLILQFVLLTQVIFGVQIWGFTSDRRTFKIGSFTRSLLLIGGTFILFQYFNAEEFRELNLVLNLSTIKVFISLVKQIPQILHNVKRKSMYGISKLQICLDIAGAIFCLLEFHLKNTLPILEAINSNRGKIGIATVTLLFSSIFLVQFTFYSSDSPNKRKDDDKLPHDLA